MFVSIVIHQRNINLEQVNISEIFLFIELIPRAQYLIKQFQYFKDSVVSQNSNFIQCRKYQK